MATDAGLVIAMEARLDRFERQLKEAGLIADREVRAIEDRFARANPQFGATFAGSFLGNIGAQAVAAAGKAISDLTQRFAELDRVAKQVDLSMNDLFGIQEAASRAGAPVNEVTQSVKNLAILLDQMQRGEENSLSRLFDANPEALRGVNREALTLQQTFAIVADLVQNSRTEIQKIDLAKAAGQAESMVGFLEQGGAATTKLSKAAADAAPDLQRLANQAKEFDALWKSASDRLKAAFVEDAIPAIKSAFIGLIEIYKSYAELFTGKIGSFFGQKDEALKNIAAAQALIDKVSAAKLQVATPDERETRAGGNAEGGGTGSRDPSRGLSNVPPPKAQDLGPDRDRFDTAADSLEKRVAGLNAEANAINLGTAARERARVAAELETIAKQANGVITAEQRIRIDELAEAYGRAAEKIERAQSPLALYARESANLGRQLDNLAASTFSGFENAIVSVANKTATLKEAFTSMTQSILNDLLRIAIRKSITGPIADTLFGAGGFSGLLGIGRNAEGTNNWRGGLTWVGEKGPEILNLPRGSQVIPNNVARKQMGGGVTVQQTIAPVFHPGMTPTDMAAIQTMLVQSSEQTKIATIQAIREGQRSSSTFLG